VMLTNPAASHRILGVGSSFCSSNRLLLHDVDIKRKSRGRKEAQR
jgi:hypothetical protein